MATVNLSKKDFQKQVLEEKRFVFVDFYAPWCGPCQMMGPIIDQLSEEKQFENKIKFVKVNVDQNPELATQYNIFSIPTFIIFKDGQVVSQFTGAIGKEGLIEQLNKVISSS